jgi:hypothetical protein
MLQTLANQTDPELIDTSEDCMLTVWQERYPDRWLLEAIRKPLRTVAAGSRSLLAVMKRRAIAGTEPV